MQIIINYALSLSLLSSSCSSIYLYITEFITAKNKLLLYNMMRVYYNVYIISICQLFSNKNNYYIELLVLIASIINVYN